MVGIFKRALNRRRREDAEKIASLLRELHYWKSQALFHLNRAADLHKKYEDLADSCGPFEDRRG